MLKPTNPPAKGEAEEVRLKPSRPQWSQTLGPVWSVPER
jgi:hypothetical protein